MSNIDFLGYAFGLHMQLFGFAVFMIQQYLLLKVKKQGVKEHKSLKHAGEL